MSRRRRSRTVLTFAGMAIAILAGAAQADTLKGQASATTSWIWRAWTGDSPANELPMYALSDALVIVVEADPNDIYVEEDSCIEGDINGDCIVNLFDVALFAEQWLQARGPFIESGVRVVIEAEHYQSNSAGSGHGQGWKWFAKDIAGSIGDGCLQALPDYGANIDSDIAATSPHLTYEIEFSTTGTYYLWTRGTADNTAGDSIHYGVDGVVASSGAGDSIQLNIGSFGWSNGTGAVIASIDITSAGLHTLDIWMREDGVVIDRLLLTTDAGYIPGEPPETGSATKLKGDINGIDGVTISDYALLAWNWLDSSSPVIISEFMASNSSTIDDEDGESSDWIEIYNRSEMTIDMTGWYLTDEAGVLNKWQFTAGPVLKSGDYAFVFASGKSDPYHPMHTNFQLSSGGEYLGIGLILPNEDIGYEYSLEYPAQETDISYGLFNRELQYFAYPTPGEDNRSGYFGIVADTKFSVDRGFYDKAFSVAITCDEPNAIIRYTTDSENPTEISGTIYDQPIQITGTTVLKAVATKMGWISSNVDTQTYIFVSDVKVQSPNGEAPGSNWPSGDINGQYMNYGMDPEVVNNPAYSGQIEGALLALPAISISTSSANLFSRKGIYVNAKEDGVGWERPASMELIYPDGRDGFQIDMGLRIRGAWSRMANNPKHAFRCFFRGKYGDSKLKYPLFGEEGADEFEKIDLRAEQNYSWGFCNDARSTFVHEVFTRDTQGAMGQAYTRSRYYHLYLNGHYWGLYQTQERSEARYAKTYMGGEVDDYDVAKVDNGEISYTDGNLDAYERLYDAVTTGFTSNAYYFRVQGMNPDGTENPAYERLLDIENVIAYNLMCYYFGGIDYPLNLKTVTRLTLNNLYGIYNRNNPDGWKFFIHDAEHTFGLRMNNDRTYFYNFDVTPYNELRYFNPVRLHQELFDNLEYRIAFADAVYKHLFNGGALSEDECFDRLYNRISQVEPAIIAESARWGDAIKPFGENNNYTCGTRSGDPDDYRPATKAHWESAIDRLADFMTGRTNRVFNWIKNRSELHYPSIDPPVSHINASPQHGGYISAGNTLTMTNPNGYGTIYYTLDRSDPRLIGGAVNPGASIMGVSTAEVINKTTQVKARVKKGSTWSALNEAVYADDRIFDSLRISEIMYHPADPNTEFIELQNIGAEAISLNLVKFTKGVDFTFGDQTLSPGEFTVIVQDRAFFEARCGTGLDIAGQYTGRLDNKGERIEFQDAVGTVIQNFKFEDNWYELTDGPGFSLTMVDPASGDPNDWEMKFGWRSSLYAGGTPGGAPETGLAANSILINELLAHSHGSAPDWIELYNATDEEINISGWFLSDDDSDPNMIRKYQIPANTTILGGGYVVFMEDDSFGAAIATGNNIPFGLSEGGETVYLYSGQGGEVTGLYQTQQKFDASETGVSFGRYEKEELSGGYDFVRMTDPTQGKANTESSPLIPEIVITEIYYHPWNGTDYEFVELYNRSGHDVALMTEVKTYTSETDFITEWVEWRLEGTGFEFPINTTIPAHSFIVVAKNPAYYSSALGPYDGKLDNGGEELEIQIPGDKEYGKGRYWIPIEKIDYDDEGSWPKSPDGAGDSLHRINIYTYGRDHSNWTASTPTPWQ